MREALLGIGLVSIVWAQTEERVWDWHGEGDAGQGYHQPGEASDIWARRFHTLRLTGDTLWVLGRVCIPDNQEVYLPSPTGPIRIEIPSVSYRREASFIALYDRTEGTFWGALLAYAQAGAQYGVRFVDFVLSNNRDTLWVTVDFPTDGCNARSGTVSATPDIVWQDPQGLTHLLPPPLGCTYSMASNQATAQVWQIAKLKQSAPTGWEVRRECFSYGTTGSLSLGLHGLAYRPGELFVSGTMRLPSGGNAANHLYPLVLGQAALADPLGNPAFPFWVKLQTGSSFGATHASVFYRSSTSSVNVQGYGRALLLKGDTLLAFFNFQRNASSGTAETRYRTGDPLLPYEETYQIVPCGGASTYTGHIYLLALRTTDLQPVGNTLSASLQQLFCGQYDISPQVGTLYPFTNGDTLWLAWSDSRPLSISLSSTQRGLFMYWTGVNSLSLVGGSGMPWVVGGALWTGVIRTPEKEFYLVGQVSNSFALGHWTFQSAQVISPSGLSGYPVEGTGIAVDPTGHLYLFGTGRVATITYEPVRPRAVSQTEPLGDLSGIIHALNKVGYGRAWMGRLLRYRAELLQASPPLAACAPDTIPVPFTLRLYGRFDAPSDSVVFLWQGQLIGSSYNYEYETGRPRWNIAAALSPPGGKDSVTVSIPRWTVAGRLSPGQYKLIAGISGWNRLKALYDSGPLQLTIQGNAAPSLYPLPGQRYWVYPFAGGPEATIGWRQAAAGGSFYARSAHLDGNASISPHYAFAYIPAHPTLGGEYLYVAINYHDSVFLYRVRLLDRQVEVERGWPRVTDPSPNWEVSIDSIVYGIQQLVWNPQTGTLLAVEGTYRLRVIFPGSPFSATPPYPRNIAFFMSTLRADYKDFPLIAAYDPSGAALCVGRIQALENRTHLLRDNLASWMWVDWTAVVLESSTDDTDPCMDAGSGEPIASPRALVAIKDTIYLLDWGRVQPTCNQYALVLIRRSSGGSTINTPLDTLYRSQSRADMDSVRANMLYLPKPAPHLLIPLRLPNGTGYILRYWLDGRSRPRDTLIGGVLVGPWSCEYSVDRWSPQTLPRAISLEMTRGGTILFSASSREIRAAMPLYINRSLQPDSTQWLTDAPITQIAGYERDIELSSSQDTLQWHTDSLYTQDTVWMAWKICTGTTWPARHYCRVLHSSPAFTGSPGTVCQGEIFHASRTLPSNDALLLDYLNAGNKPAECGVKKLVEEVFISGNLSISPPDRVQQLFPTRWVAVDTCLNSPCQITLGFPVGLQSESAFLSTLTEGGAQPSNLRIRRGHQMQLRVALEAPSRTAQQSFSAHPAFSRLGLYRMVRGNSLGDSLYYWDFPTYSGVWEFGETWQRISGAGLSDTTTTPSAWRTPSWVTPCLVILRETPDGPRVDSVLGFIDTLGRVWKWAPPMVDTTDCPSCPDKGYYQPWRLSFCRCDTSTPKWVVIRFPQHLPLRSAAALDLSRDPNNPTLLDFTDPSYLDGIPGMHYTFISTGGTQRAATWAGNCADEFHSSWPGMPQGAGYGVVNAADYEFILLRNGVTGTDIFSPADIDCDGAITAADMVWVIQNQNALRQSVVGN